MCFFAKKKKKKFITRFNFLEFQICLKAFLCRLIQQEAEMQIRSLNDETSSETKQKRLRQQDNIISRTEAKLIQPLLAFRF